MPITSRIPTVLNYLVTTFQAASTIGGASPPVTVYYGPAVSQRYDQKLLWVGIDRNSDPPEAATSQEEWTGLGARWRDERMLIMNTAEAWSGDNDIKTVVDGAFGIVSAVEAIIQNDANLGGNVLYVNPGVTGIVLQTDNVETGAIARVSFRIDALARIGGP